MNRGSSKKGLNGATVRHAVGYGNSVESIKKRWTTENVVSKIYEWDTAHVKSPRLHLIMFRRTLLTLGNLFFRSFFFEREKEACS
jgi:hypothetical protein